MRKGKEVTLNCKLCAKSFTVPEWRVREGRKYCSLDCSKKGYISPFKGTHTLLNTGKTHFKKGFSPWNTGKGGTYQLNRKFEIKNCLYCNKNMEIPLWRIKDPIRGKFCSQICKGKYYKGELANNWRGGINQIHRGIRETVEYEEWRKQILERGNYTCRGCGKVGGWLEVDHIKPFALYPELRLELDNGQIFCKKCHSKKTSLDHKIFNFRKKIIND